MLLNSEISNVLLANSCNDSAEQLEKCLDFIKATIQRELSEKEQNELLKKLHNFKAQFKQRWDKCSRILQDFHRKNSSWLQLPFKIPQECSSRVEQTSNKKDEVLGCKRGRQLVPFDEQGLNP